MARERTRILATVVFLLALGIVMVYSSSATVAGEAAKFGSDPFFFLKRQALWVAIALAALAVFARIDHRRWQRLAFPLLLVTAACLILVLIPGIGRLVNGARRWLRLGPVNIQPSEVAKLAVLFYCAAYASGGPERLASFWKDFLPGFVVLSGMCGLVILEPDVGSSLFLGGLGLTIWVVAGARWRHIALVAFGALGVVAIGVLVKFHHVLDRLKSTYQLEQALIAMGSGEWRGVGLGQSRLKLFFLPERHTDFIFAIVGEELGFLGAGAVVGAFAIILVSGWRICRRAPDRLGMLLSVGALILIVGQAVVNMAVVTGLLPTKGISLPFVSYGGSSLIVSAAAAGVLMSVARSCPEDAEAAIEEAPEPSTAQPASV